MMQAAIPRFLCSGAALFVLRRIAIAIVAGGILAALGPFGSYMNGGPVERTGYWIAAMLLGLLLYGAGFHVVTTLVRAASPLWWPALLGVTVLVSVPEALLTRAAAFWLWPELAQRDLSWPLWLAQTTTIGLVAMIAAALLTRRATVTSDDPASRSLRDVGAVRLGKDVLALQMEDHYVRVHRASGSELILMPLGRAIAGVGAEGLRVHRSWWVVGHAVQKVEGNARSMRLHLSNGVIAPVARSAVIHLKAAGWLVDRAGRTVEK